MMEEEKKGSGSEKDVSLLESYIEELFSFTPLPLCFINPKGIILEANPAFLEKTRYEEEEVVGENISTFVKEEDIEKMVEKVKEEDSIENVETEMLAKDGDKFPVAAFAKSRLINKELAGIFFSFLDISEVKKKEKEAKKANKKLKEKVSEMEKINRLTIGRELKMVKLKERVKELEKELEKHKGED